MDSKEYPNLSVKLFTEEVCEDCKCGHSEGGNKEEQ